MDTLKRIFVEIVMGLSVFLTACGQHSSTSEYFQKTGEEKVVEDSQAPLDQMQRAIFDGDEAKVEELISKKRVQIEEQLPTGRNLLSEATYRQKTRVMRLLKQLGAVVETGEIEGQDLVSWCKAQADKNKLLRALFKTKSEDEIEMMEAVHAGQFQVVKALLLEDVDVNFIEPGGETPLTWAIKNKSTNVLRALFAETRLDVNLRNFHQESTLMIARRLKLKAIENELIKRKALE